MFRWWAKEGEETELARELVGLKLDVIVTSADGVLAAHEATKTVPIVAAVTLDVVARGLADSLGHLGGITGETFFVDELSVKRLAFLRQITPAMTTVGLLVLPRSPFVPNALESAAKTLGVALQPIEVAGPDDCDRAFSAGPGASVHGLLVSDPPEYVIGAGPAAIAAAAARHSLPAAGAISIAQGGGILLRRRLLSDVPPRRCLRRQNPQGRKAGRHPDRAGDAVHHDRQSQDGQSARPRNPAPPTR